MRAILGSTMPIRQLQRPAKFRAGVDPVMTRTVAYTDNEPHRAGQVTCDQ
jgi:hypothetical protein